MQHSESYQMYIEMDANVEKVSKCIYVALMKVSTLGSTLPALFKTIFEYYMSSSTEDLYFLPYVGMYVINCCKCCKCLFICDVIL